MDCCIECVSLSKHRIRYYHAATVATAQRCGDHVTVFSRCGSTGLRPPTPTTPFHTLNSQWYYIAAIKRSLSATGSDAGQNSSLIFYTRSASRRQLLLLLSVCLSLSLYLSLYSRLQQAFWLISTSNYNSSPFQRACSSHKLTYYSGQFHARLFIKTQVKAAWCESVVVG